MVYDYNDNNNSSSNNNEEEEEENTDIDRRKPRFLFSLFIFEQSTHCAANSLQHRL